MKIYPHDLTKSQFFYSEKYPASGELRKRFQLYTFSYQTDLAIKDNGRLLANALRATFDQRPVQGLAHSMGGLVTRSALANWSQIGANIAGLITLGTPHHGTVIVENIAGVADKLLCLFALDAQGALDLRWDSFNTPLLGCTNDFLCGPVDGLNMVDQNYGKYLTYAGDYSCLDVRADDPAGTLLCATGGTQKTLGFLVGLKNDGVVPELSASLAAYDSSALNHYFARNRDQLKAAPRVYPGIHHISIHDALKIFTQNPDGSQGGLVKDLMDF